MSHSFPFQDFRHCRLRRCHCPRRSGDSARRWPKRLARSSYLLGQYACHSKRVMLYESWRIVLFLTAQGMGEFVAPACLICLYLVSIVLLALSISCCCVGQKFPCSRNERIMHACYVQNDPRRAKPEWTTNQRCAKWNTTDYLPWNQPRSMVTSLASSDALTITYVDMLW